MKFTAKWGIRAKDFNIRIPGLNIITFKIQQFNVGK